MSKPLIAALLLLAGPALAQQPSPAAPGSAVPGPAASGPAVPGPAVPGPAVPGIVATTSNPNLTVAAVRLDSGQRLTQVIGASVFSDAGERLGGVDDLVMIEGDKVSVAIIAVGGFLGLGSKLVAVPYQQLRRDGDRLVLPGVTKDALEAMPSFNY